MKLSISLTKRIIGLMSILLLTNLVVAAVTLRVISAQKSDGVIINLAGRQRMLSQIFGKEVLGELRRVPAGGGSQSEPAYRKAQALFEKTHCALVEGGETFEDLGMTKPVTIPKTTDEAILAQLTSVDQLWRRMVAATVTIFSAERESAVWAEAFKEFESVNGELLKAISGTVASYQALSDARVATLKTVQYSAGGFTLAIFAVAIWLVITGVTRPLNNLVKALTASADSVEASAVQVSEASKSLADGAVQQADSIEQVTAAMEEFSGTAQQNAANANKANDCTQKACQSANDGSRVIGQLQEAMAAIEKSAEETSKVLSTIEDIAFQTNLLALNAAIEAEGAGEHGRRFAVVAEEVRRLAGRCTEAAKDTATLIGHSAQNAKRGVLHCTESGSVFAGIRQSVEQASSIVGGITGASSEQATTANHMTGNIAKVDEIIQSNAAAAEQSSGAAHELKQQVDQTHECIQRLARIVNGG